jgi:hypothetical protein
LPLDDYANRPTAPIEGTPPYEAFEAARYAMGDTRHYAERIQLSVMEPLGDLSSTGYVLANPGQEYLILQPSPTADPFTVTLAPGSYTVEWYRVTTRETTGAGNVTVERERSASFTAPFAEAGPVVLYLKHVERG